MVEAARHPHKHSHPDKDWCHCICGETENHKKGVVIMDAIHYMIESTVGLGDEVENIVGEDLVAIMAFVQERKKMRNERMREILETEDAMIKHEIDILDCCPPSSTEKCDCCDERDKILGNQGLNDDVAAGDVVDLTKDDGHSHAHAHAQKSPTGSGVKSPSGGPGTFSMTMSVKERNDRIREIIQADEPIIKSEIDILDCCPPSSTEKCDCCDQRDAIFAAAEQEKKALLAAQGQGAQSHSMSDLAGQQGGH